MVGIDPFETSRTKKSISQSFAVFADLVVCFVHGTLFAVFNQVALYLELTVSETQLFLNIKMTTLNCRETRENNAIQFFAAALKILFTLQRGIG
jgi:hypothetical protein